jgi:trans-2-enoyl-CoA reductase
MPGKIIKNIGKLFKKKKPKKQKNLTQEQLDEYRTRVYKQHNQHLIDKILYPQTTPKINPNIKKQVDKNIRRVNKGELREVKRFGGAIGPNGVL